MSNTGKLWAALALAALAVQGAAAQAQEIENPVEVRRWLAEESVDVRNPGVPRELAEFTVPFCTTWTKEPGEVTHPGYRDVNYKALLELRYTEAVWWRGHLRGYLYLRNDVRTQYSVGSSVEVATGCTTTIPSPRVPLAGAIARTPGTNELGISRGLSATACRFNGEYPIDIVLNVRVSEATSPGSDTVELGPDGEGRVCLETEMLVPIDD